MQKFSTTAIHLLAAGMLLGNALAQQTPAATTPPASPAPATSPKAQTPAAHSATAAKKPAAAPLALKTQKDKFSYALGMNQAKRMSEGLKKQSVPFDSAIFLRGMKDGFAGGKTLLTEEEAQAVMTEMQKQMHEQQQAKAQQAAAGNKKEGDAFLAANKGKEGVVTLPSGLQYKIVTAGTGPKPTTSDSVVCNYRGTLINGTEFDSSYKRGQPATFPVTGVIKGWTEALQLMPVGSKWQLFIPADLAYGDRGAGADIGPGATLVFEIELLSIADKSKDKAPGAGEDKK
ncbi:MAG TPA: FKBP-type peptidyl-prolyl cis-trans isomerase [Verrucomicrobiae bacterium]|jgi:FKBP-type peptidyl-prolyl cis-trans isomerase FklB|nr:FKBP-type peptidyl-prolyl cis-trans isomerase [Verrucomicrobiae bacterium]